MTHQFKAGDYVVKSIHPKAVYQVLEPLEGFLCFRLKNFITDNTSVLIPDPGSLRLATEEEIARAVARKLHPGKPLPAGYRKHPVTGKVVDAITGVEFEGLLHGIEWV